MTQPATYLRKFLTACLLLLLSFSARASHIVGADLSYAWLGGNLYKITLTAYGDCGSAALTTAFSTLPTAVPKICIYNGNTFVSSINLTIQPPSTGVEITPVCPADLLHTQCTSTAFTIPGIKKFVYSGTFLVPFTSTVWRFLYTGDMGAAAGAGRAAAITNIASGSVIQLVDTLNNTVYTNSNPLLTVIPTPFFCVNNNDNYNPGAIDPEADSLSFFLVPGMGTSGAGPSTCTASGSVSYTWPYTAAAPLATTAFSFDQHTGQIAFFPNALQRSLVVYNIEEYRHGVLVGTSQREMTFLVLTCTNPPPTGDFSSASAGTIDDATHFHICTNSGPFSLNINPTDPNPLNTITVTYSGLPAGATFSVIGNGTTAPHCTFSWTSSGIPAGSYTFFVTYTNNNCPLSGVQTLAYTITILPQPTVSFTTVSTVNCFAKSAISIVPGGTGGPWTVTVTSIGGFLQTFSSVTGAFIDSLIPGNYTISIASVASSACNSSISASIVAPPPITIFGSITNPSFCGNNDGTIRITNLTPGYLDTIRFTYNGLLQPYQVITVASDGSVTLTGLLAGTYSGITATDGRYCVSAPIGPLVLVDPPFTMRSFTTVNPDFCGICNGVITLYGLHPGQLDTVNFLGGGVPQPPIIRFVASDSLIILSGLCAGTYSNIIAKTAGVCRSNPLGPAVLTVPPFTMRAISYTNPDYCGICNGVIILYGLHPGQLDTINYTLGGVPQPPVVHLIGPDSMVIISGLCAGTYANFIANTGGVCFSNMLGPVTLTVPPFTMRSISYTNPDYCGICNGTITLHGLHPGALDTINYNYNGVPQPAIVVLIGSDSEVVINGLCPGIYSNFIARTSGGCVSNMLGPVTLTVPPFTMRDIVYTNPDYCGICNGTITLRGLHPGNLDTINYTYNGVAQPPIIHLIASDSLVVITGLCAGTYANFVATTGGTCVSNTLGPVTLTVPPFTMRSITSTNPDYCGICNGTITLHGLHPGNLDTINYTFNGVPQPPFIHLIGGDSLVVITGLCAGLYANFVATTGGSCVSNTLGPVTLTVPPFRVRDISYTNPDYCGICNGTITLYGLHPGNLDTLNYTLNGVPQPPVVHLIAGDSLIVLTGLCNGLYNNFIVNTGGSCISNPLGPVTLTVPPFTMRAFSFTNPDFCGICNGSVTLYGLHPGNLDTINYTLNGVPQTPIVHLIGSDSTVHFNGLCAGLYANFIANTAGSCISNSEGPANLVVPPFTMRAISYTNPTKCGFCDGEIKLSGLHPGQIDTINYTLGGIPQPAISVLIPSDSSVHIDSLCAGTYDNFTARTGGVCVSNVLGPVTLVAPPIIPGFTYNNLKHCQIDTIVFTNTSTPAADLTYRWSFGDGGTDVAINPSHTYTVSGDYKTKLIITNTRCVDSISEAITIDNILHAGFKAVPDTYLCQGKPVIFTNTSTGVLLNYTWLFGDGNTDFNTNETHVYKNTGIYKPQLVVSNYVPCHDTVSKWLTVDSISLISMNVTDSVLCGGHDVIFTGAYTTIGLINTMWTIASSTSTTNIANVNPLLHGFDPDGQFTIRLSANYRACPDTSVTRKIWVFPYPSVSLGPDTSICLGGNPLVLVDNANRTNSHARWVWSTGEKTSEKTVVEPGTYSVKVIVDGCSATDSVVVENNCFMNIPNVFSPNGDGLNDYFFPRSLLTKGLATFKMEIYNRWGQQVFQSESLDGRGWDGRLNGVPQPEGVFIYRLSATFIDGQIENHQGNVTLIR